MKTKQKETEYSELQDLVEGLQRKQEATSTGNGVTASNGIKPNGSSWYLKEKIKDAFRRSTELRSERILVNIRDGTVELWGSVRTWAEINEAERIVRAVPGVSKVEGHLYIAR